MTNAIPSRGDTLRFLNSQPNVPVLIIGAGVNGAGLFRDLALQGVDCLIVDKGDVCSGTSAAPSRLIHGGLKYLETGEFRLVAESTRERNLLLKNAPHFVRPLPTVLPIHSYFGGIWPSIMRFFGLKTKLADRGLAIVEVGLAFYDLLGSRHRVMPRHSFALRSRSLRALPHLTPSIVATATYYDAQVTQAERLCYELVADAQAAHSGARAATYMAVTEFDGERVILADGATGRTFAIRPQIVVNAAGPWIDTVNRAMTLAHRYVGGTKGSHLVIENAEFVKELGGRMIYFGSSDGRICLVYPFLGHVLLGSTDIRFDDPDEVRCDDDEVVYMLAMLREVFPNVVVRPDQIIYRYSGVRPLPFVDADDPGDISRDHAITRDVLPGTLVPLLSLIGGKWTTFRCFAAEAADAVLETIGRKRTRSTEFEPIGGGRDYPQGPDQRALWSAQRASTFGVSPKRAALLLDRYGTRAETMLAAFAGAEQMLASLPDYSQSEIRTIARREQVVALADLVFRRTTIALSGRLSETAARELAGLVGSELGWNEKERERQIAETLETARSRHGMNVSERHEAVVTHSF